MPSPGGANDSAYAASTSGGGFTEWGAGMGFDLNHPAAVGGTGERGAYDASGFRGIALVARGNDVTMFAAPGSHSTAADVVAVLDPPLPAEIGGSLYEAHHVSRALQMIERAGETGRGFDVIHDHNDAVTVAFADRTSLPVVHTLHGPFTEAVSAFHEPATPGIAA